MSDAKSTNKRDQSAIFTWSNLISFSRIFVAIPIIWLHQANDLQVSWLIGGLVFYGIISDYLDGMIARKTGTISEWGVILDPFADKLTALLLFIYTVIIGYIPLWFLIVEILRDIIIASGSLYIKTTKGSTPMSVMSGKWSVNALSAYWMSAFFLPTVGWFQTFWLGVTLTLMLFSFIDYLYRFTRILNGTTFS